MFGRVWSIRSRVIGRNDILLLVVYIGGCEGRNGFSSSIVSSPLSSLESLESLEREVGRKWEVGKKGKNKEGGDILRIKPNIISVPIKGVT